MSKHTPGPWHVDLDREFTQNGDVVSVEALTPCRKLVVREVCTLMLDTGENKDGDDWEEDAANARLIAETPTLLMALEVLIQACQQYRIAHDTKGDGSLEAGRAWDHMRRMEMSASEIVKYAKGEA